MKRCHGLASLILLGLIASAARAEPPTSGPKLGAKIVPLKPHKRGPREWQHVLDLCWLTILPRMCEPLHKWIELGTV